MKQNSIIRQPEGLRQMRRGQCPSGTSSTPRRLKALSAEFFDREPVTVGKELLGKLLVRRYGTELLIGRVVETEAYLGTSDPAAHAYAGRTGRNAVLFGPPGLAYVYFIYGNHFCLNVSCMPEGEAGCVLFRALEPVFGLATMAKLRGIATKDDNLEPKRLRSIASGPGKLTQAMHITRQLHNGIRLTSARSELFLADDGFRPEHVAATPRIGITKATDLPLRYVIAGTPYASKRFALPAHNSPLGPLRGSS